MTTKTYTDLIDHTSDAGYRAWASRLHNAFVECGLVATNDSGQIDFDVATRPATHSFDNYRIYRFDDAMQSSRPIFIRVEYGTGADTDRPALRIGVGSGTDGSGKLTGMALNAKYVSYDRMDTSNHQTRLYPTRVCVVDGCFWFVSGTGSYSSSTSSLPSAWAFFVIGRTVDNVGDADDRGALVITRNNSDSTSASPTAYMASYPWTFRYNKSAIFPMDIGSSCLFVGGIQPTVDSGKFQAFVHYASFPEAVLVPWLFTVNNSELSEGATFDASPVGGTGHKYISLGLPFNSLSTTTVGIALPPSSGYTYAMVWE